MNSTNLVILRIVFYTIWALAAAWTTSMADVHWSSMGWEAQSCVIGGVLMQWTGVMVAFFDKSVWRMDAEKVATGQTIHQVTQTTQTTDKSAPEVGASPIAPPANGGKVQP